MLRKIIYVQYTNPAVYPPLQHSSRILANAGWHVLFLGTGAAFGADSLSFPYHERISVKKLPYCSAGWKQKLHYCWFALWVMLWTLRFRPTWIYVSDHLASPAALITSYLCGPKLTYHEHDTPIKTKGNGQTTIMRFVLGCRRILAKKADFCIIPNEMRLERFKSELGVGTRALCVWNCPAKEEVMSARNPNNIGAVRVIYQGSIVPARLPESVIKALEMLPDKVSLSIAGYETIGSIGYIQKLYKKADDIGLKERVECMGTLPREQILDLCRSCDVGLSLLPRNSTYINEQNMVGASNKPFDYLACGLALLVPDLPEWREMYVYPGYGLACDPEDPNSIAQALNWFLEHPEEMRLMGEKGRRRIEEEWNYENQFNPILRRLIGYDR
jgi:glycosyltransferase involved in cell wall biosynthesis